MRIALDALEGYSLNVERSGSSQNTIIAIHGFTGNASTWDSFVEAAGTEFSIIRPDLPGHGKSDAPDDPRLYDMEHTVRAMAELLDRLEVSQAHWLGYSLGGRITLAAAFSLKDRFLSLIVESTSAGLDTVQERKERDASDESLANLIEKEGMDAFVDYWEKLPLWGGLLRLPLEDRIKLKDERRANNPVGLAASLRGIGTGSYPPLYKRLPEIKVPCLFIAGEEDIKFSVIAQRMQNVTPRSQISLISKSGHTVHLEQPGLFNRTVIRFIRMSDLIRGMSQAQPGSQPSQ